MSNEELETQNELGGITLAEISGLTMDEVAEVRFEDLPAMKAIFKFTESKWEENVGEKKYLTCRLTAEVLQVGAFNDNKGDDEARAEKVTGRKHNETMFIDPSDPVVGLGRIKAFFIDCGFEIVAGENVAVMVNRFVAEGNPFIGVIKKRPRPNSDGEFYTNLVPVAKENNPDADADEA